VFASQDLVWWQSAALPALVLVAWLLDMLLGRLTRGLLGWLAFVVCVSDPNRPPGGRTAAVQRVDHTPANPLV
jgi:hypothetical protein